VNNSVLNDKLKAIQGYAAERPGDALSELDALLGESQDSLAAWMLKGSIHFQQGEFESSSNAFATVLEQRPKDELASVGLFHSLWSLDKRVQALEELKRYLQEFGADHDSEIAGQYRAIIGELNQQQPK
jgi:predicted Zn-dependent protease